METETKGSWFTGNRYCTKTEVELQRPLGGEGFVHLTKDSAPELAFPDQYLQLLTVSRHEKFHSLPAVGSCLPVVPG